MKAVRFLGLRIVVMLGVVGAARLWAAAPGIPAWVTEAAACPTPEMAAAAPALVLLDEWRYDVQPNGRVIHTRRYAVRVLNSRSGAEQARAVVSYLDGRDTVIASNAWLVRAGKEVRPPKTLKWADVSAANQGAIYDESRSRAISYEDLAFSGDVFACETQVDRGMLFGQLFNVWHAMLPTVVDRCVLRLPPGWSCEVIKGGNTPELLQEVVAGQVHTWELLDRPYRPDETSMDPAARRDAVVWINLVPPAGATGAFPFVPHSWAELAQWDWNNSLGQCDTDAALAETVRNLVADCSDTLARMRVLSRYVQQLRYAGVNADLALGGGLRPRKATEVHAKGWGDCKDKANLLVAMLREVGVEAFIVTTRPLSVKVVDPQWPSAMQFNHAIVGIRVDDSIQLPAEAEAPGIGRLLFFDATDPDVLLGDLPWGLEGARAYVVAPGTIDLATLPRIPVAVGHRAERRFDLVLESDGSLNGRCVLGGLGSMGAALRSLARTASAKDQRAIREKWLNGMVRGARLLDISQSDDLQSGDCRLELTFAAPKVGQSMPGGLMLLRLDPLDLPLVTRYLEEKPRLPISILGVMYDDQLRLTIPPGMVVEEIPAPVEFRTPYGRYERRTDARDGVITIHHTFELEEQTVPAVEGEAVKKFFQDAERYDRSLVVLRAE